MLEKLTSGQRIVIASIVSIVFFFSYEFIFGTQKHTNDINTSSNKTASSQNNPSHSVSKISENNVSSPSATLNIAQVISNGVFNATISQSGTISQFYLLEKKFRTHDGKPTELFNISTHEAPMSIRFIDNQLNDEAKKIPYVASASTINVENNGSSIVLTQKLSSITITKTIIFYPDGKYSLQINMDKEVPFFVSPGYRPIVRTDSMTLAGILVAFNDDKTKTLEDGSAKEERKFNNVQIVAAQDHYYTTAMYDIEKPFTLSVTPDVNSNPTAFIAGNNGIKLGGYIGPKNTKTLTSINPKMDEVVEYGYLTFMAKPMFDVLSWIDAKVGNWGWAIVILTIMVRLILFPLTLKGMVSMNRIKELAPKMQDLKEKYKGDAQKLNMHMLELYKKHNANPLSGCLPLLLQIPIFFALYKVLLGSVELKGAAWILWITDLSEMDPYFILPILMGATMFIQQRITPMNFSDPMQEKIIKYLPVVFTVFFVTFPAGLTLYWFVSNVLSVAQQYAVNRYLEKHKVHHD